MLCTVMLKAAQHIDRGLNRILGAENEMEKTDEQKDIEYIKLSVSSLIETHGLEEIEEIEDETMVLYHVNGIDIHIGRDAHGSYFYSCSDRFGNILNADSNGRMENLLTVLIRFLNGQQQTPPQQPNPP
jgi:hypothetical protein